MPIEPSKGTLPPLDDKMRVRFVLDRFEPLKSGKPALSYSELRARYGYSEHVIQQAIRAAFHRKVVAVVPVEPFMQYHRVDDLESALRRKYEYLKLVIVVEPSVPLGTDDLHKALGHVVADHIHYAGLLFNNGDVIGVGTGRAIHHTIESLTKLSPVSRRDITIMSLTGSLFPAKVDDGSDYLVDADANAGLLARHFRGPVRVRTVGELIATHSPEARKEILAKTWLSEERYAQHPPNIALVGLGVLTNANRLVQEANAGVDDRSRSLEPVRDLLKSMVKSVAEVEKLCDGYTPVGDFCNCLFVIPPPANAPQSAVEIVNTTIAPTVDALNERLITVTPQQLSASNTVILIAGGPEKAPGIGTVLSNAVGGVNCVCLDRAAAEHILAPGM